jgi:cytochrome c biogenesis protein CcdA
MPWPQFNHIQLLRYAGLFQYASVGTPFLRYETVVEDLAQKQLPGSYVHLWLACYVVFGVVYWYLTHDLGDRRRTPLRRVLQIGLLVVLNLMAVAIGWFSQSGISALLLAVVAVVLPWLLPLVYGSVILLGLALLLGKNPFARLATANAPIFRNPLLTAFAYGLLLGPMTLPCAGPLIVSAFVLGAGSIGTLADSLAYTLAFGLGFGWPLVALPLLAVPAQRYLTRGLAGRYDLLTRASGLILIGIALFGAWTELL